MHHAGSVPNLAGYIGSPQYEAVGGCDGVLFYNDKSVKANIAAAGNFEMFRVRFSASNYCSNYTDANGAYVIPKSLFIMFCIKYI